jgi:serine/threonine protein kinase
LVQVLGHVSQRIADLHKEGFVHRDLKPGNIMWQPRTYSWVLIDFGLVARIKESAPVGCTPGYAAPETALALLQGHKQMIVDEKVDSWALGVIAYELLMERSAFGVFQGVTDVRSELLDLKQLLSAHVVVQFVVIFLPYKQYVVKDFLVIRTDILSPCDCRSTSS